MGAKRIPVAALQAAVLRRIPGPLPDRASLVAAARALSGRYGARAQACVALDGSAAYLYAWMDPARLPVAAKDEVALVPHAAWCGASAGTAARYHYVVATDVESGWEGELNRWYDEEHMPGLAAVPGNALSSRLRCEGSPRYHSCYDLESPRVLERSEWLAVRNTEWSSRVRPRFRNTVRIMFESVLDER